MIYQNAELRAKLTHLTLVGQNEDGSLEWAGSQDAWEEAEKMEKELLEGNEN